MPVPRLDARATALTLTCVSALAVVPVMTRGLAEGPSFVTAVVALVACFDLLSIGLLAGVYRDNGDRRVLALTVAYTWSLVVMTGYAAAFPGVMGVHPPLMTWTSVAPYLWVSWHAGFPLLLGLAYAPWPTRWTTPAPRAVRTVELALGLLAATVVATVLVTVVVTAQGWLPSVISGTDTTRMTQVAGPWMAACVVAGTALAAYGSRYREGAERWVLVACTAVACDVALTLASRHRYSVGWYAGRTLTVVAAGVVLWAMLADFTRIRRRLLQENRTDPLTRLANRPAVLGHLDDLVAGRRPVAVLLLDLDGFKQVNDRLGHAIGDAVLVQAAARLRALTGEAEIPAVAGRLGGDEFLVVFESDDRELVQRASERVVEVLGDRYDAVAGCAGPSSSGGLAWWGPHHTEPIGLVAAADAALYEAKRRGGSCVVVGADGASPESPVPRPREHRELRHRTP